MKSIFIASGLIAAAAALSSGAYAQDAEVVAPTIVVTAKYQKDWNKGSKIEAEGLKDLEKAKKDLIDSSADVVSAQNKRDSSGARADNASADFRKLTSNTVYFTDAQEAERWARQVEKAASEWAKYDKRGGDGRDDLGDAMKKQRSAQAAVDKAQAKVDLGRTMKVEAERLSSLN